MSYNEWDDDDEEQDGSHGTLRGLGGGSMFGFRRSDLLRDVVRDRKQRGVQMVGKFASILTSREVKASLVSNSGVPAPAWSTSNTIGFDEDKLKDLGTIEGLLSFKGLSVHEVSHILFSPRSGSDIAQWVRDENMNKAYQVLEDQRIETLLVGRFGASVVPWLVAAAASYLLDHPAKLPSAYPLVRGRRFLPVEVRSMLRDAYENPGDLNELSKIIDEYRLLLFPEDTERAKELIAAMNAILNRLTEDPQQSCGSKDADSFESSGDSRPLSRREQRDARDNAKRRRGEQDDKKHSERKRQQKQQQGQSKSDQQEQRGKNGPSGKEQDQGDEQDEQDEQQQSGDGDGQQDQDKEQDDQSGSGQGQQGDDEQDEQGDSGSDGTEGEGDQEGQGQDSGDSDGSGSQGEGDSGQEGGDGQQEGSDSSGSAPGSEHAKQQADQNPQTEAPSEQEMRDALQDAVNQAKDTLRNSLERDLREVNGELELMSNDAAEPKASSWSLVPADQVTARAASAFGRELERLKADNEPGWERVTPSGRINASRYLRGAELDEAFDRWTIGREDATDIEAVILVDTSGSMQGGRIMHASNAMWGIKRALDRVNARCTVVAFNSGTPEMVYKPMETATAQVKRISAGGGTDPSMAIKYGTRVLAESDRSIKLLFSVTDGEWSNEKQCDEQIKTLRQAGVLTALAFIDERELTMDRITTHNHEIVAQIKSSADLFVLGRHLVRVATARNLARP